MSQRNPMNERYQQRTGGQTRKSAASAKPVTKAASSVYVQSGKPAPKKSSIKETWDKILGRETKPLTAKQQKAVDAAEARKQAEKQRRKDMNHFKPQSSEYKKYSTLRIFFYVLGFALVLPNVIWSNYFCAGGCTRRGTENTADSARGSFSTGLLYPTHTHA